MSRKSVLLNCGRGALRRELLPGPFPTSLKPNQPRLGTWLSSAAWGGGGHVGAPQGLMPTAVCCKGWPGMGPASSPGLSFSPWQGGTAWACP